VPASWDDLPDYLAKADVLVACTGAAGTLVDRQVLEQARRETSSPLGVLDLAMPHDVDAAVADLPGVELIGMADLAAQAGRDDPAQSAVAAAQAIVSDEVGDYIAAQSAAAAVPTVVALRRRADDVVAGELDRLTRRLGDDLDPRVNDEVAATLRRVVGKLLHTPTVRVKDAASLDGDDYEAALRHLFALDPGQVSAVSRLDAGPGSSA
jgi:glutamyl-tRNA reductase